ncbi:MAG: NfeD family protein [Candidatus Micrarchaeota archaeon]
MSLAILLIVIGLLGVLGELFIPGGIMGIVGFGMLICGVLLYLGVPVEFAVVGGILAGAFAGIIAYVFWARARSKPIKTGAEAFIGFEAKVCTDFSDSKGIVHVKGEEWSARSRNRKKYKKGDITKILGVSGVYLEVD